MTCKELDYSEINQSIDQSINQSINQSNDRSINQSIDQSANQSINQSNEQSINPSIEPTHIKLSPIIQTASHIRTIPRTQNGKKTMTRVQGKRLMRRYLFIIFVTKNTNNFPAWLTLSTIQKPKERKRTLRTTQISVLCVQYCKKIPTINISNQTVFLLI